MAYSDPSASSAAPDPNDWWAQNDPSGDPSAQPPGATSTAPPTYSNPALQRIADAFKQYTGRDPSQQEVMQWGPDIDAGYLQKILLSIAASPEAQAYAAKQHVPTDTNPSAPSSPSGGGSPMDRLNALLAQYPNDPQKAIDAYNALGIDNGSLAPAWYPGSKTIGLANGTYLVMPGTGGNSGTTWQVVQRGDESGGSTPASSGTSFSQFNLTPAPTFQPVKLPTQAEVEATPGFQFDLGQGQQAIDRKNASIGTYLSGGADKEQAQYATGLANQYYQNAVGNALNVNQMNNQGALQNWEAQNGLGLSAFGANLGAQNQFWNQGFQENQNAFNQYNQSQQQAFLQWLALAQLGNPGSPYA